MLSMVFLLPTGFGFVVWRSYRKNQRLRAEGAGYQANPGAMRWGDQD